jgi:hypothetical protein
MASRLLKYAIMTFAILCLALPGVASAQGAPAAPTPEAKAEALARYERGLQLYNEQAYEQALIEITRAYELNPSYKLLYNIGQIQAQLNNFAGALKAFEQYIADGGKEIAADRKAQVTKEIENLKTRTATAEIKTNVQGVELLVDGLPQPVTNGKVLVNAGVRKFQARKPGYQAAERIVTLAGGDNIELTFDLAEAAPPPPIVNLRQSPTQTVTPEKRSLVWVGWLVAGGIAAAAIGTGVAALSAQSTVEDEIAAPKEANQSADAKRQAIDDAESKRTTLSVTTDVLIGCASVAGIVSLAFTIKEAVDDKKRGKVEKAALELKVAPAAVYLTGQF